LENNTVLPLNDSNDYDYELKTELVIDLKHIKEISYLIRENWALNQIIDARSPSRFNGEAPDSRPG
jgi:3-mercaptopyruvate sulfurtransferase SseA